MNTPKKMDFTTKNKRQFSEISNFCPNYVPCNNMPKPLIPNPYISKVGFLLNNRMFTFSTKILPPVLDQKSFFCEKISNPLFRPKRTKIDSKCHFCVLKIDDYF